MNAEKLSDSPSPAPGSWLWGLVISAVLIVLLILNGIMLAISVVACLASFVVSLSTVPFWWKTIKYLGCPFVVVLLTFAVMAWVSNRRNGNKGI